MTIGVVVPCYRQETHLARTLAAVERALAGREWQGALVMAAPGHAPLPPLSPRWRVIAPPVASPLTPGAARMLGFAACGGDWVLFPDADIEIEPAWLGAAMALAEREPSLGGIWGRIEEWFTRDGREWRGSPDMHRVGDQDRRVAYITTPALYRRQALIAAGGYDARLNSEEDFELGMRMTRLGLELRSLGMLAAKHWSGPRPSFAEIGRRWRTGLCFGTGQVLRIYAGRPGMGTLVRRQSLYLATLAMWTLGLMAVVIAAATRHALPLALWLALPVLVLAVMTLRKRSLVLAVHSLLVWTVQGAGLGVGLLTGPRATPPGLAGVPEARC